MAKKIELGVGATYLGRGPQLGVTELKCSRRQMLIRVEPPPSFSSSGGGGEEKTCVVYLTALGVNPSVLHRSGGEAVIMKKGEPYR